MELSCFGVHNCVWAGGGSDTQGGVVPPLLTDQQRRSAQGEAVAYSGSCIKDCALPVLAPASQPLCIIDNLTSPA